MSIWGDIGSALSTVGGGIAEGYDEATDAVAEGIDTAAGGVSSAYHAVTPDPVEDALGTALGAVWDAASGSLKTVWKYDEGLMSHYVNRPLATVGLEFATVPIAGVDTLWNGHNWSKAWEQAQDKSAGQAWSVAFSNNFTPQTLNPFKDDVYAQLHKEHPWVWTGVSGGLDAAKWWFLDPMVVAGKGLKGVKAARQLGRITKADRAAGIGHLSETQTHGTLKVAGVPVWRSKKLGMKTRTNTLIGAFDKDGNYLNGLVDEARSGEELYHALPQLEQQSVAGARFYAQKLYDTNEISDAAQRLKQRQLILNTWRGDPDAIGEMQAMEARLHESSAAAASALERAEAAQELGRARQAANDARAAKFGGFYNYMAQMDQMKNAQVGSVLRTDAMAVRDDTVNWFASHGLQPPKMPWGADPQEISRMDDQIRNMVGIQSRLDRESLQVHEMLERRATLGFTPSVTAKGRRAMAKSRGEGLARNGELHTGFGTLDSLVNRSATRPLQRVFADTPHSMPMRVIYGVPVKTAKGVQWGVDKFWNLHPSGVWHLRDKEETTSQLDAYMRRAGMSSDERAQYLDELARVPDRQPIEAQRVSDRAVKKATARLAEKHGIDDAEGFLNELMDRGIVQRNGKLTALKGRMYSATKTKAAELSARQKEINRQARAEGRPERTWYIDQVDDDGVGTHLPVLDSQNVDLFIAPDINHLDKIFKRHKGVWQAMVNEWKDERLNPGAFSRLKSTGADAYGWGLQKSQAIGDHLFSMADELNRWWKFSVLFRLGYLQRVLLDDHSRILAMLGAQTLLHSIKDGTWNTVQNLTTHPALNHRAAQRMRLEASLLKDAIGPDHAFQDNQQAWAEIRALRKKLPKVKSAARKQEINDRLGVLLDFHPQDKRDLKDKFDLIVSDLKDKSYRLGKKRMGHDDVVMKDGTIYPGAFAGKHGEIARAESSSQDSWMDYMGASGEKGHLENLRKTGSFQAYSPMEDPGKHLNAWVEVLNRQFRHSDLVKQILSGKSDKEIVRWLRRSPRGKTISKNIPYQAAHPERWIANVRDMVDEYLPSNQLRDIIAKDGKVTHGALRKAVPEAEDRPVIHGPTVDINLGEGGFSHSLNSVVRAFYRWVGKRNDAMSRHPLYITVYKNEARRLHEATLAEAKAQGRDLTSDDLNRVSHNARIHAKKMVNRVLFDVVGETEMAHAFRFVAPFFNAWQEGLNRWWRIVSHDPAVVRRFQLTFDAPRRIGIETDYEGNPVAPGDKISDNHYILFQLPKALSGVAPKEWQSRFKVSEASFNLIFQGGSLFNPGAGPWIQAPTNALTVLNPKLEKYTKAILPLGTRRNFGQPFIPTVGKYGWTYLSNEFLGHHSNQYNSMYSMFVQDLATEFQLKHGRPPNQTEARKILNEAQDRTSAMAAMRFASSLTSPASIQVQSKFAPMLQSYQRLQEQGRKNGYDYFWPERQFIQKWGNEYFPLTQSKSLNNVGLLSSVSSVEAVKRHKPLLNELHNPDLFRMVVGPEGEGAYSQAARNYFYRQPVQPGSSKKMVSRSSPEKALDSALVAEGWNAYDRNMQVLNVAAQKAGFKSYLESDKLTQAKSLIIAGMAQRNPAWFQDYSTHNDASYTSLLTDMRVIANNKELASDPARPDIHTLQQYLAVRDKVTEILKARDAAGGSASPQAKSNKALMALYGQWVSQLVEQNPIFEKYDFQGTIEHDPYLTRAPQSLAMEGG